MKAIIQDIQNMSLCQNIDEGLSKLKLVTSLNYRLKLIRDWEPGGAETYICQFQIIEDNKEQDYILKACTKMSCGHVAKEWIDRRNLIKKELNTPKLFGCAKATFLEEYIPYTLFEVFHQSTKEKQQDFICQLANFCKSIDNWGFRPIALFHDLRSRGNDIVMIDFGEDLGGFSLEPTNNLELYKRELCKQKANEFENLFVKHYNK